MENKVKFNKFKSLAVVAVVVAAGLTSAHADDYGSAAGDEFDQPTAQTQQITQEDVGNFFKGIWTKTKEGATNIVEKGQEIVEYEKFSNAVERREKRREDDQKKIANAVTKTWNKTKEVTSTVGVAAGKGLQIVGKEIQNMAEPSGDAKPISKSAKEKKSEIQKAEISNPTPITSEDVVKAKDKVIDGVTGFLSKLRSEPNTGNNNSAKP